MTKRLVGAGIFISLYLIFLAWYDGWGKSPMTAAEVDSIFQMFRTVLSVATFRAGCASWGPTTMAKSSC